MNVCLLPALPESPVDAKKDFVVAAAKVGSK